MHIVGILGLLVCLVTGTQGVPCRSDIPDRALLPCGDNYNANANTCGPPLQAEGRNCCYREGRGCMIDGRNLPGFDTSRLRNFVGTVSVPTVPSSNALRGFVQRIPSGNNPQAQRSLGRGVNPNFQRNALQSSLTLGLLLGTGGIANLFPKCPVHVKLCYRVPCGGYGDTRELDNNPGECLKDPTCCFDYELAFLKSIFGPTVMGGAPSCYYGPTSQQWRYITSFFQPWNAWFTNFIVEAFKEVFNTNLFNIGGQVLCQFDFQVKNYPVGSKSELECNLVSGCWDSSRPVGKQCTLASSIIKNIFGGLIRDDTIYPSLYTDDISDTQCVSNWFDFGPRAYRRMECDVKDEPDEFVKKLTDWCPWQDCCLNYAAFTPSQIAQLSLISSLGGGGNPIGGGILPISGGLPSLGFGGSIFGNQLNPGGGLSTPANSNLLYLLAASSSSSSLDLEKLFCPYRNLFPSFIDLTETTEGCCDIPKCYHKKKYVRPAQPTPPPTLPPPIFPGIWGQWGQCNAACGQQGSRTRTCFVNGATASSTSCAGPGTETCFGQPCPQVSYRWGSWTTSACSTTCGGGIQTYTRPCLNNFRQSVDSSLCPGGASSGTSTATCNTPSCPVPTPPPASYSWGQWTTSACSATCGGGTLSYSRPCLNNFGQPVDSSLCPGGAGSGTSTASCNTNPCPSPTPPPATYSWGPWQTSGCSATCGSGTLTYTRPCLNNFGQTVDSSLCPGGAGRGTATTSCNGNPCPASGQWGAWQDSTSCGASCGRNRIKQQTRICTSNGFQQPDSACPGASTRVVQCPDVTSQQYHWTGYTLVSACTYDSTTGVCSRTLTRYCYQRISSGWTLVQPQSLCSGQSQMQQNCDTADCFSG